MTGELTVASLCSGYDGITQGLRLAGWDLRTIWHAENDPDASKVLAFHGPGVPNHGDITRIDWATLERPDVLTAGFPCQDISNAGRRAGLKAGTRSGLWITITDAIDILRPQIVVIENVEGILSAKADRGMGPSDPYVEAAGKHALRALGCVLGDLADLGYDARWCGLPAAAVGAPHRRVRIFLIATPAADGWAAVPAGPGTAGSRFGVAADAQGERHGNGRTPAGGGVPASAVAGGAGRDGLNLLPTPMAADGDRQPAVFPRGNETLLGALLPTPTAKDGMSGPGHAATAQGSPNLRTVVPLLPTPGARLGDGRGTPDAELAARRMGEDGRRNLDDAVALLPTPRATDGTNGGPNQRGSSGDLMLPSAVALLPTPTAKDSDGSRNATATRRNPKPTTQTTGWTLSDVAFADRWAQYASAVSRWEAVRGRPAPEPTEPGRRGKPRLSARFVEWMMGLPDGWVTAIPYLVGDVESRRLGHNAQLRILGNGVVPQQAALAIALLTDQLPTAV